MEAANRVLGALSNAANNNTVINVCLTLSFLALSGRSMKQQREIQALEGEKDSLAKSNKAMRKALWDWKQQLFAEASATESALVPLSRLQVIYGESPAPQSGDASKEDAKAPATKFVI